MNKVRKVSRGRITYINQMYPLLKTRHDSRIIAIIITSATTVVFMLVSDKYFHWFVIPVVLNGIVIGTDAVDMLRGRLSTFSAIGIVGIIGYHFFYIAPMLHIAFDSWMRYVIPPDDWRPWLGGMASLNFVGLQIYRRVRDSYINKRGMLSKKNGPTWILHHKIFIIALVATIILTASLQVLVYIKYGGISGYIQEFSQSVYFGEASFVGMGYLFSISESFPILLFMLLAYASRQRQWKISWPLVFTLLVVFFVLTILFGGLRGSRSNTIWKLFWAVGIVHFWIRPITKKIIVVGILFLTVFMYGYGFFKAKGLEAIPILGNPYERITLEEKAGRSITDVLLGDLARSDVQAYLLYKVAGRGSDFKEALGRTYIAGVVSIVPRALWLNKPVTKIKEGTEALYGQGTFVPGIFSSTRVYGLAGEAMLNFGPAAAPIFFILLGLLVGKIERMIRTYDLQDARWLLIPMWVNLSFLLLTNDSDNIMFFLVKNGFLPFMIIVVGSRIYPKSKA